MAKGKHISEDEIKYIVDVESAKAQQEIRKLEKSSAALRTENKRRLDQMIKLEAQGFKRFTICTIYNFYTVIYWCKDN